MTETSNEEQIKSLRDRSTFRCVFEILDCECPKYGRFEVMFGDNYPDDHLIFIQTSWVLTDEIKKEIECSIAWQCGPTKVVFKIGAGE